MRTMPMLLAGLFTLAMVLPAPGAHAAPSVPPGFALQLVTTMLPDSVTGLAIAGPDFGAFAGQAFVSSYASGRLWRIDETGSPRAFASGLVQPSFIRFGPGGSWGTELYVSANSSPSVPTNGRIVRFDPAGTMTDLGAPTPPTHLFGGGDIAFSDGGPFGVALYVGISAGEPGDCVALIAPPGAPQVFHNFAGVPGEGYAGYLAGMAFGSGLAGWTDDLYAALFDSNTPNQPGVPPGGVYRISSSGEATAVRTWNTDARVRHLVRIAFGPDGPWGRLMYASTNDSTILTIASDGTVTTFVDRIRNSVPPGGLDFQFDALGFLNFIEPGTRTLWRVRPLTASAAHDIASASSRLFATPTTAHTTTTLRYVLPAGAAGLLECFDVGGRRMRSWKLAPSADGGGGVAWDGRDDSGRPLPNGLYFARITARGAARVARVTWVR